MKVLIIGAGGHGQVVFDTFRVSSTEYRVSGTRCRVPGTPGGGADGSFPVEVVGFLDDDPVLRGKQIDGVAVLGGLEARDEIEYAGLIVAIGENRTRSRVYLRLLGEGERFANAIHPRATVSPSVSLGRNVMICAGAVVTPHAVIGDDVILNTSCSVDHDNIIENHAHIAPGAHLGGDVTVGEGALVGIGASVRRGITIGEWAVVGVGAAVIEDVPPHTTVIGVPARRLEIEEWSLEIED